MVGGPFDPLENVCNLVFDPILLIAPHIDTSSAKAVYPSVDDLKTAKDSFETFRKSLAGFKLNGLVSRLRKKGIFILTIYHLVAMVLITVIVTLFGLISFLYCCGYKIQKQSQNLGAKSRFKPVSQQSDTELSDAESLI
eukprot:UN00110